MTLQEYSTNIENMFNEAKTIISLIANDNND